LWANGQRAWIFTGEVKFDFQWTVTRLDLSPQLARKLLSKANKSKTGSSWPCSAMATSRNLTGLANGASGIGCALLQLLHATSGAKYCDAAAAAFAYERR
jgi:lantibiotic modifying enzyme